MATNFSQSELETYRSINSVITKLKANLDTWSLEWRLQDYFADGIQKGYSRNELEFGINILFDDAWATALERATKSEEHAVV